MTQFAYEKFQVQTVGTSILMRYSSEVWLTRWCDGIPSFGTDSWNGEVFIFHWSLESYLHVQLHPPPNFRCFILNLSFASVFPLQIQKVILSLGDYMQAACHACIGGTNVRSEINKLSAGAPHIVVGTPGRVYDMLSRGHLCEYLAEQMSSSSLDPFPKLKLDCWLSSAGSKFIKMFVLDEADEMLSRGFKDQIYEIFQKLSTNIQVSVTGDTHTHVTLILTEVF